MEESLESVPSHWYSLARCVVHAKIIAAGLKDSDTLCWKERLYKARFSPLSPYPNHKLGI